jgi:hypothetical protein
MAGDRVSCALVISIRRTCTCNKFLKAMVRRNDVYDLDCTDLMCLPLLLYVWVDSIHLQFVSHPL